MRDFVSTRGTGVWPLAAAVSLAWPAFVLSGLSWTGLLWVSLAFSIAVWVSMSSTDLAALPVRVAMPAPKAVR
jgi:hypothetical protein